jgi:prepilin-type N-terminal cleavage/methylation domain-containing protein
LEDKLYKRLFHNKKTKKGFTLIELMVVVAIIGILALIGLRVYAEQQNKTKDAVVKGNVATIHTLVQSELADSNSAEVWGEVNAIINNSGIHLPAGAAQTSNVPGTTTAPPALAENGGKVFVFVDNATAPTEFYINGVNAKEDGWVYGSHLTAVK